MSTTTKTTLEAIKAHMAAEDRQDVEATLETFTEDCYYRVPGLGVELRGKDQIRNWYEETYVAVPDFRNANERYWEADGNVFFEADIEAFLGELHEAGLVSEATADGDAGR